MRTSASVTRATGYTTITEDLITLARHGEAMAVKQPRPRKGRKLVKRRTERRDRLIEKRGGDRRDHQGRERRDDARAQ
jgi:hypothetical protein